MNAVKVSRPLGGGEASQEPGSRREREVQRGLLILRRKRWRSLLVIGAWALFGLLFAGSIIGQSMAEQKEIPWSKFVSELFGWYLWGLLFPLILWVTRRFPFERKWPRALGRQILQWGAWLLIHVVAGFVISTLYAGLALVKHEVIVVAVTGHANFDILGMLPSYLFSGIEFYFLVYFVILAVIHAVSYYEKYRDRELKASRLETQLALAQLQVLKMQLHPHFLFNTLNAISALMHRDVEAADRMIASLSDLLRLSLDKDDRHQVPLQSELEFLDRYLAIEKIRFRDRLSVELDVEPRCLEAQVPKLMLQPLVENSIRYGIASRSAAGKVAVRARRKGNRLHIEIFDDGPGLPDNAKNLREGVGLANTRARLEQFYGADHRFELRNVETGGLSVNLEIPFEIRRRFSMTEAAVAFV